MNEEYLWNKTGSDPDIEELEDVLKTFRLVENSPPQISKPVVVSGGEGNSRLSWVRPLLAYGAGSIALAGLVLLPMVVYRFDLIGGREQALIQAESARPEVRVPSAEKLPADEIASTKVAKSSDRPAVIIKASTRHVRRKQSKRNVRAPISKPRQVLLTNEERYAYDQLMLGLSITSDNLKIVQDKVRGTED